MMTTHDSDGVQVSKIRTIDEQLDDLPGGLSFFDPFLHHEVREEIEAGGEAFISHDSHGVANGLFIYDGYEATGTVFTKSREVFDYFYRLKPSSYIFSELEVEDLPKENWNIWQLDVDTAPLDYRFRHPVSMEGNVGEIERFVAIAQPETNRRWIGVALGNGQVLRRQNWRQNRGHRLDDYCRRSSEVAWPLCRAAVQKNGNDER